MTKYEDVLFQNGFHVLMIRLPGTEEYIVFDEHGLIFMYTDQDHHEIFEDIGEAYQTSEPLIHEVDHWHISIAGGQVELSKMIRERGPEEDSC
ncbi:MAG: hypothetical protein WAR83_01430 [Flavobacteriales bacterium]